MDAADARYAPTIANTANANTYLVTTHELNFRSFHVIGQVHNEHPKRMRQLLQDAGVEILGPLETIYTFHDDPHGPDIPHGRFTIEVGLPVPPDTQPIGEYTIVNKAAYRYICHQRQVPPYDFGWGLLRDSAEAAGLRRTLQERDVQVSNTGLGDEVTIVECREVVE